MMKCPRCRRKVSFWESCRIHYPLHQPCPKCKTVLTLDTWGKGMLAVGGLLGLVLGGVYGLVVSKSNLNLLVIAEATGALLLAFLVFGGAVQYAYWQGGRLVKHPNPKLGLLRKKRFLIAILIFALVLIACFTYLLVTMKKTPEAPFSLTLGPIAPRSSQAAL